MRQENLNRMTNYHSEKYTSLQYIKPIILFVLLVVTSGIWAGPLQTVPRVTNFSKNDYHASNQNWNIAQDRNGILYFANNEGLLQYDGSTWQVHRLPNRMGLRSVTIGENNRIYTGSYEEFGYWESAADGTLVYHSLSKLLKNYKFTNDEIWRIIIDGHKAYFQSFDSYFVYDGQKVTSFHTPGTILFFLKAGNNIYTQGIGSGLFKLQNDLLKLVPQCSNFSKELIYSAIQLNSNTLLLGTASNGLYLYQIKENKFTRWKTEADDILTNGQINCGIITADSVLCFGTISKGIVALDRKGKILWHFRKDYSLNNNTVLYLFNDKQNNVWAALDKGIALIHRNSPFRFTMARADDIESVYTAVSFQNNIYLGSNQGVFQLDANNQQSRFSFVPGTQGQVWQLSVIDNQLICGHNEGTFRIEGDKVTRLSAVTGGTSIKSITANNQEYLIQGTYTALVVYKKDKSGNWVFSHKVKGFSHPVRYLEVDHLGYVWASHILKGLYRIKLNRDLTEVVETKSYGISDGLPGDFKINVFKISGRVVFCTGVKFFTYDDLKQQMVPYAGLNQKVGEFAAAHAIIPAGDQRYWLVTKGKFALIETDRDNVTLLDVVPFSFLNNALIDDNEYIAPIDENKYLFCLDNGLAIYDRKLKRKSNGFLPEIVFRQIRAISNKSSIYLPVSTSNQAKAKIPYTFRRIVFSFAYPEFSNRKVNFCTTLNGHKEEGQDTISTSVRTFTYLAPGQYVLDVSVHDETGKTLTSSKYYFEISPPFYASPAAYIFYLVVLGLTIYYSRRALTKHIEKKNREVRIEQMKLQQQRIERREQKIVHLKNEKLQAELVFKSKELASSTMAIIRKNDMLTQLRQELEFQKQKLGSQYPNKYYDRLVQLIDQNISSDDDWHIFQQNFDMIHENFFRNIKKRFPDLTSNDLKLCAYLHLNLSTKEIASLLNISIRGVEAARYRLRKKLSLTPEANLTEFFIAYK
ncbi:MAG: sigma-70 region 4 domain-containing protein [Bacteroidota bacterium]|nr:sigma-70 region 4 domain-containing protein [Bacteroidota bacterium]